MEKIKKNSVKLILIVIGITIIAMIINAFYTKSLSRYAQPEAFNTKGITYDSDMTMYENLKRGWRNLTGKSQDELREQLQDLSKAGFVVKLNGVQTAKTLDDLMYGYNLYANTDTLTITYTVLDDLDDLSVLHYVTNSDIDLD